jgi:predicted GIY-YIG superfamily endonuclease
MTEILDTSASGLSLVVEHENTQQFANLTDCKILNKFIGGDNGFYIVIHQHRCMKCIEWMYENDQDRFKEILSRALDCKNPRIHNIVNFAISIGYDFESLEIAIKQECELLQDIIQCSIPFRYPQDIKLLPSSSGVYLIIVNNQNSKKIVYIGSSLDIRRRLSAHNLKELQTLVVTGVELLIYCLLFPLKSPEKTMKEMEMYLINELKPALNKYDR